MEVGVRVEAEDTITDTTRHVLTAYLTMVALDDRGRPTEVRPLEVDEPEASRRCREAQLRRDIRLAAPPDLQQLHATMRAGNRERSPVS
jgi:acyl-CoA hydrolase